MVGTVLAWGFNFVAVKMIYAQVSPPALGFGRHLLMWGCLAAICRVRGYSLAFPAGDAPRILLQGALAMGLYMILFLEGLRLTSPGVGAILLATAPIFTALFAAAARQEAFRWGVVVGGAVAVAGVALVVGTGHGGTPLGAALIVGAAVVWSLGVVVSRPLVQKIGALRLLTLSMPGALPILAPYALLPTLATPWTTLDPLAWALFAHVVLLAGVLGFLGFYLGVRKIGGPATMLYQFFVPPTAMACAWWLLGEPVTLVQALGLAVIVLGVWWSARSRGFAAPPVPATTGT